MTGLDAINRRIDAGFESYPKLLRIAARYVRDNPEKVALSSLRQLARQAKVHPSSLMRLVRELGFERYNEFRDPFKAWLGGRRTTLRARVDGLRSKGKRGGMNETIAQVFAQDIADLEATSGEIKTEDLAAAADIMIAARRVFVVGFRSLHSAAFFLDYSWKMIAPNAVLVDGRGGALGDELRDVGPRDAVVVLSHRSYSRDALRITRFASEAGASIVSIVDSPLAPTAAFSRVTLVVNASHASLLSSIVSTLSVVQALIAIIVSKLGDEVSERLKRNDAFYRAFDSFVED
jgi:DNA-binding MurR/RpiR family transcriptional regulator